MKSKLFIILITILFTFCSFAHADNSVVILDGFDTQGISLLPNHTVLFSGYISEDGSDSIAALRVHDLDGTLIWEHQEQREEGMFSSYRDAEYVDAKTMLAILTVPYTGNETPTFIIQRLTDGQITATTTAYEGLSHLYLVDNVFWVTSTEIANSRSILRKFDMDLNLLYELVLDGHQFLQILTGEEFHIAYGYSQKQEDGTLHPEHSVLFAFDNSGNILWNADSVQHEVYTDAVWLETGKFALLGRNPYNNDPTQFFSEYFVLEYESSNRVSRTDSDALTSVNGVYRNALSICQFNDGYLIPLSPVAGEEIPFIYVNPDSKEDSKVFTIPTTLPMTLTNGQVFAMNNAHYLIGNLWLRTAILELPEIQ